MKKYLVIATMYTKLEAIIEAESIEQAQEIAEDTDGGQFTEVPHAGDWEIYSIKEIAAC